MRMKQVVTTHGYLYVPFAMSCFFNTKSAVFWKYKQIFFFSVVSEHCQITSKFQKLGVAFFKVLFWNFTKVIRKTSNLMRNKQVYIKTQNQILPCNKHFITELKCFSIHFFRTEYNSTWLLLNPTYSEQNSSLILLLSFYHQVLPNIKNGQYNAPTDWY